MQIALVDMQRRVQGRVPLPWIQVDPEWLKAQQAAGLAQAARAGNGQKALEVVPFHGFSKMKNGFE